jgi:AcrR family transcriptional regulator
MAQVAPEARDRISRRQVDKFAQRRAELAEAALQTLAERGYARTSLREIAQNSAFSHGVLHYYFRDKVDLITHCVRQYKARCVTRYDEIVTSSKSADELMRGFGVAMAGTLREDASMHGLWYDLRNQSMFETSFLADVTDIDSSLERMIWRIVSQYGQLAGSPIAVTPRVAYALFDGLFQQALRHHVAGSVDAGDELAASVQQVLAGLVVV